MSRVRRIDLSAGESLAPPVRLPNGSWRLQGYATRAGVFRYLNPDGSERWEFRPPEEVEKSAAGLALCLLTHRHPPEGYVTPATAGKYQRGMVLESRWDGATQRVPVDTVVTDQRLLDALADGEQELSAGYSASVTEEAGEWQGQRYTHVQRAMEYNHLAVVPHGRAGPECAIRLDAEGNAEPPAIPPLPVPSIDTPAVLPSNVGDRATPPSEEGNEEQPMEVEIVVKGKTFKVPKELADALAAEKAELEEKAKTAQTVVTAREGELATVRADVTKKDGELATVRADAAKKEGEVKELGVRLDSATAELERMKKERTDAAGSEVIEKKVTERVDLITRAKPVLGEKYEFAKASTFTVHCDTLDKLLEGKEALKKKFTAWKEAKDERSVAVLFDTEMSRFDAGETQLGGAHGQAHPPAGNVDDAIHKAQEELRKRQRENFAKKN